MTLARTQTSALAKSSAPVVVAVYYFPQQALRLAQSQTCIDHSQMKLFCNLSLPKVKNDS